jgi:ParB-like chromosome segregation protein Spo0J
VVVRELKGEHVSIADLRPYPGNARTHSKKQVQQIAKSIERFGFTNPALVSDENQILAGHGRVQAAKLLGMVKVPIVRLSQMTEAERKAYLLADNKLALNAGWDREIRAIELQGLVDVEFDIELTGFSLAEIDIVLDEASENSPMNHSTGPEDQIPSVEDHAVTRMGDICLR